MTRTYQQIQNIDALYPSRFLKAADLDGPIRVAIDGITSEDVGLKGRPETKTALHFVGMDRPMILNVTNKETLKKSFGINPQVWRGKFIEVYPTETLFGTETVPCLRIRIPAAPRVVTPVPAPASADEVPF